MEGLLAFYAQQKTDVLPGTTNVLLSHKRSVASVLPMQEVHTVEILFYNELRTLKNMEGHEIQKRRQNLKRRLANKKNSLTLLFDTETGLFEKQN